MPPTPRCAAERVCIQTSIQEEAKSEHSPTLNFCMLALLVAVLGTIMAWIPPSSLKPLMPPSWPPTYNMSLSTIAMPCNDSGFMDENMFVNYGIVSWDWSNAKQIWVQEKPMDSENALVRQAARVKAANKDAKIFVYRNSVHAMPWFPTVRTKLQDPAYSGFFLKFDLSNNRTYYSPRCDDSHKPPRCSDLYHDQTQTPAPKWDPKADGRCDKLCDCGSTGLGNDNISGFFLDDYWCFADEDDMEGNSCRLVGPAETEIHVLDDLGMDAAEVKAMSLAWRRNMDNISREIHARDGMTWDMSFGNSYLVPGSGAMTVPKPTIVTKETCIAVLSRECAARGAEEGAELGAGAGASLAMVDQDEGAADLCCCATANCPVACPSHCPLLRAQPLFFGLNYTSKDAMSSSDVHTRLPQLSQDLANFLLLRGDYAWLGFGFLSCHNDTNYTLPAELQKDYGTPLGPCKAKGGGVFSREWTKATVTTDCGKWEGSITGKSGTES